jgi:hypothetical protein
MLCKLCSWKSVVEQLGSNFSTIWGVTGTVCIMAVLLVVIFERDASLRLSTTTTETYRQHEGKLHAFGTWPCKSWRFWTWIYFVFCKISETNFNPHNTTIITWNLATWLCFTGTFLMCWKKTAFKGLIENNSCAVWLQNFLLYRSSGLSL